MQAGRSAGAGGEPPYYFNRFTNQSLWEMPVLGQHDVLVSADLGQGSEQTSGLPQMYLRQLGV